MHYLQNYYKNLCEQLQEQINILEKKLSKLADKDYDGDGTLETGPEEHAGSVDKAIKANIAKKKKKKQLKEGMDVEAGNFIYGGFPRILNEAKKMKEETEEDESEDGDEKWIEKAIKKEGSLRKTLKVKEGEKIPVSKLKKAAKEGGKTGKRARLALTLKKINESKELRMELEKHLDSIAGYGQKLHATNHPDRMKYGKALNAFTQGNFNNADELISMGADPTAIGKFIAIQTNPEYQDYMKQMAANADPTLGGLYSND